MVSFAVDQGQRRKVLQQEPSQCSPSLGLCFGPSRGRSLPKVDRSFLHRGFNHQPDIIIPTWRPGGPCADASPLPPRSPAQEHLKSRTFLVGPGCLTFTTWKPGRPRNGHRVAPTSGVRACFWAFSLHLTRVMWGNWYQNNMYIAVYVADPLVVVIFAYAW